MSEHVGVDPSPSGGSGVIHFTLDDGGQWAMSDYLAFDDTAEGVLVDLAREWTHHYRHHGRKPPVPVKIRRRRGRRRRNVR